MPDADDPGREERSKRLAHEWIRKILASTPFHRDMGHPLTKDQARRELEEARHTSSLLGLPFIDLTHYVVAPDVAQLVPLHVALRHNLVPVHKVGKSLTIAIANPSNHLAIEDVGLITGCDVEVALGTLSAIQLTLFRTYGGEAL